MYRGNCGLETVQVLETAINDLLFANFVFYQKL